VSKPTTEIYRILDRLVWVALALVAAIVLLAAISGCGGTSDLGCYLERNSSTMKIVNGEVSVDRRAAVQVRINGAWCTGTVLGPNTVLTAEHCLDEGVDVADVSIRLIQEDLAWPAADFELHPSVDIAVVHVADTIPGPYAQLWNGEACYPDLIAQGYGRTESGYKRDTLHERTVRVVRAEEWGLFVSEAICFGDSGSSLYVDVGGTDDLYVVGVASKVRNQTCTAEFARGGTSFFANTVTEIDWIEERIF